MKKRKLKGFVLPSLYVLITVCVFVSVIFLGSSFSLKDIDYNYGTDALIDKVESVIVEDVVASSVIESPADTNLISVHFYDYEEEQSLREKSLIFYEQTYLPSTGLVYASDTEFEVKTSFAGTVKEINSDEFFGEYVVVEHSANLKTYYYGLTDIEVQIGDELTNGTVIGMSKENAIMKGKKSLLFEVYYNNELINPEKFINTKITDYE